MRAKTSVVLAILVVTGVIAAGGGAQAAFGDCPANHSCLWGNNDFVFLIGNRAGGGGLASLTGDHNNQMDSWGNRTATNSAGYDGNGSGDCQTFTAGSRDNNVAPWNSDEVSSWRTNGGC